MSSAWFQSRKEAGFLLVLSECRLWCEADKAPVTSSAFICLDRLLQVQGIIGPRTSKHWKGKQFYTSIITFPRYMLQRRRLRQSRFPNLIQKKVNVSVLKLLKLNDLQWKEESGCMPVNEKRNKTCNFEELTVQVDT